MPEAQRISVPLSALEHHAYCPRQAALIHVDAYFEANTDTVRGDLAHAVVDRAGSDQDRHGHQVWHALPLWSERVGLHGVADAVEFGDEGPIPVEHKSGAYRPGGPADLQVAGQALCLREMFDAPVLTGVIFAGRARRRYTVVIDADLVDAVHAAAEQIRVALSTGVLPAPVHDQRCDRCSLRPECEPGLPMIAATDLFRAREPDITTESNWT
jgi:CRISPR-associated exonuclease Cas4